MDTRYSKMAASKLRGDHYRRYGEPGWKPFVQSIDDLPAKMRERVVADGQVRCQFCDGIFLMDEIVAHEKVCDTVKEID